MSELKPCPFCGGKASDSGMVTYHNKHDAFFSDGTRILKAYFVSCMACGSSNKGLVGHQTKELAIEAWNTRNPDYATIAAAARELVEAARWRDEVNNYWDSIHADPTRPTREVAYSSIAADEAVSAAIAAVERMVERYLKSV